MAHIPNVDSGDHAHTQTPRLGDLIDGRVTKVLPLVGVLVDVGSDRLALLPKEHFGKRLKRPQVGYHLAFLEVLDVDAEADARWSLTVGAEECIHLNPGARLFTPAANRRSSPGVSQRCSSQPSLAAVTPHLDSTSGSAPSPQRGVSDEDVESDSRCSGGDGQVRGVVRRWTRGGQRSRPLCTGKTFVPIVEHPSELGPPSQKVIGQRASVEAVIDSLDGAACEAPSSRIRGVHSQREFGLAEPAELQRPSCRASARGGFVPAESAAELASDMEDGADQRREGQSPMWAGDMVRMEARALRAQRLHRPGRDSPMRAGRNRPSPEAQSRRRAVGTGAKPRVWFSAALRS
mmetsp:Transcript_65502/g.152081  ORF Transcript_65502/g.152081 Transcript_65502/m.152081 type:complete len:348 (+) Transcript_65502:72-1115(+)